MHTLRNLLSAGALTLTFAAPLSASGANDGSTEGTSFLANGTLTYEVFEASVDHADLEDCPAQFDPEVVFCRLTLAAEQAHVFVFSFAGDQPLLAVKHYELNDDLLPF